MSNLVVNGANVGRVSIEPAWGTVAQMRQKLDRDGRDQVYFENQGKLFVATGDKLNLAVYQRNVARLDGQPIKFVAADNEIDSGRDVKKLVIRQLPSIHSPYTIGGTAVAGAALTLIKGASVKAAVRNGLVAGGIVLAGSVAATYLRAKHPDAFAGILR